MSDTVTLTDNRNGKSYDFPILRGTMGPDVIDISTFFSDTGMFTFDRGYTSTAMCKSTITYIDGLKGELMYRGYDIAYLAENKTFIDVAYLLLNKELPNEQQYDAFKLELKKRSFIHEGMMKLFDAFPDKAHPMAILQAAVSALSAFYSDHLNMDKPEEYHEMAMRIIAKIPTIAAFSYRFSRGLPIIYPNLDRGFTENFLYMMRGYPYEHVNLRPIEVKALDTVFMLHADHEQNASTSTVRLAGSSGANPFACIAAGIASLWGPSHGGANEAVLNMLAEIGDVSNVASFMEGVKAKKYRLMGFGHRVYRNMDPRAAIMKQTCDEVLKELGLENDPRFKLAMELERIALSDPYFIEKKLYPNVDFYSGIVLSALGIPVSMFTVIFALARTVGWISHWHEMISEGQKIGRPRQLYTGSPRRDFVAEDKR